MAELQRDAASERPLRDVGAVVLTLGGLGTAFGAASLLRSAVPAGDGWPEHRMAWRICVARRAAPDFPADCRNALPCGRRRAAVAATGSRLRARLGLFAACRPGAYGGRPAGRIGVALSRLQICLSRT